MFTFIGLSETWASKVNHDLLEIPAYTHEQCLHTNKKKGGGTSLYIHNTIQYQRRGDLAFQHLKNNMKQYLLKYTEIFSTQIEI